MFPRVITLLNHSTLLPQATLSDWLVAMQEQVTLDFCPQWRLGADLQTEFILPGGAPKLPPAETIHIFDSSGQARVRGYHTARADGTPEGMIFLDACGPRLEDISSTISHELLEQLADPSGALGVSVTLPPSWGALSGETVLLSFEVCDPVEEFTYRRRGVELSNFVFPWWFVPTARDRVDGYDFLGVLREPLEVGPGCYCNVTKDLSDWQRYGTRRLRRAGLLASDPGNLRT